jgi:hypothetical protein
LNTAEQTVRGPHTSILAGRAAFKSWLMIGVSRKGDRLGGRY